MEGFVAALIFGALVWNAFVLWNGARITGFGANVLIVNLGPANASMVASGVAALMALWIIFRPEPKDLSKLAGDQFGDDRRIVTEPDTIT